MSYKLNETHIQNVLELSAPERYDYFIKRVADWRTLWALDSDDGWIIATDDNGKELFPVWPHHHFGELCATDSWAGAKPEKIDISDWLTNWSHELSQGNRLIAVFPLPNGSGIPADPDRVENDLRTELSRLDTEPSE